MGEVIAVDRRGLRGEYHISGVVEDLPENSTTRFDFLTSTLPQSPFLRKRLLNWYVKPVFTPVETYVMLPKAYRVEDLENKMGDFVAQHLGADARDANGFRFQPFNRIYLYHAVDYGGGVGKITYIYWFSTIAFLVLVIACINFMSLTTARSAHRFREVCLR